MGADQSKAARPRSAAKHNKRGANTKCTCLRQQAWQWAYKNGRANIEFVPPRKCAQCRAKTRR